MHAYLIVGSDQGELELEARNLSQKLGARLLDFELTKIEHVRALNHFVSLGHSKPMGIFIKDLDKASLEAQNAFLKPLEEPQKNIIYFLTATSSEAIIPTIISRVNVIYAKPKQKMSKKENIAFLDLDVGQQLVLISKIKDRQKALDFLRNLQEQTHEQFIQDPSLADSLDLIEKARIAISKNGNVNLQLTNLITSLR